MSPPGVRMLPLAVHRGHAWDDAPSKAGGAGLDGTVGSLRAASEFLTVRASVLLSASD
jgi:hypothetical protein